MKRQFAFIRNGAKVRWNDPGIEDFEPKERKAQLRLVWEVFGQESPVESGDELVRISNRTGGEAEVRADELTALLDAIAEDEPCSERMVDTCLGIYSITRNGKNDLATFIGDDDICYTLPKGLTDAQVRDYFEKIFEFEQ